MFVPDHGSLHSLKERKCKYIPGNSYNKMKETLIKDRNRKRLMILHSSEDIPDLTNSEISKSNIKCENFTIPIMERYGGKLSY